MFMIPPVACSAPLLSRPNPISKRLPPARAARGKPLTPAQLANVSAPVLVAVGTKDTIAGSPHELASLLPHGRAFDIPDRDHMLAVGDKSFKQAVLDFIGRRKRWPSELAPELPLDNRFSSLYAGRLC